MSEQDFQGLAQLIRGVSVKWLKLSTSLWNLAVRSARRNVTRECMNGFLDSLEWYEGKHIGGEEFVHIFVEWLGNDESQFKNTFTLSHLRMVLLEDRSCYSEQTLAAWIRLLTKEYYKRMLHQPICYTRGSMDNVKDSDSNASSSSRLTGGKKSAPVNPSSLEVLTEEWSRLCKELFSMLDINKYYHWTFEEMLFFTSIVSVGKARFQADDKDMDEEYVSAALALDKLSTQALDLQKDMGASFHMTSGGLSARKGTALSKPLVKDGSLPPTTCVTEPMLADFLLKRQIGGSALKSIISLFKLALKELRKLVSKEECAFDGLSQDIPALWHRSVTIASGFTLEKELGYARYCQDSGHDNVGEKPDKPEKSKEKDSKPTNEASLDRDEDGSHQDDLEEDQSLVSKDGSLQAKALRRSMLKLNNNPGIPSPLLGICLHLIADASKLIPASLHVVDDGLQDIAFARDPVDLVDRSVAESQCADEMIKTAQRMIAAYSMWGKHVTSIPTIESLKTKATDLTGMVRRDSLSSTTSRRTADESENASLGKSPNDGKSPTKRGKSSLAVNSSDAVKDPMVGFYLGVLVENKNLHLQLCDALVQVHDIIWSKIAHNLDRYPSEKCFKTLLPDSAGESILSEVRELYRPAVAVKLRKSITTEVPAAPRLHKTREQAAERRRAELEARKLEAREEELKEERARLEEQKRRLKARKAAQVRAQVVRERDQMEEKQRILDQEELIIQKLARAQVQTQVQTQIATQELLKQTAPDEVCAESIGIPKDALPLDTQPKEPESEHGHIEQSIHDTVPEEIAEKDTAVAVSMDARDNDPDHIFWKLRTATSIEEKEKLLADLKAARYGNDQEGVDSRIAYYDHSPNPMQRELELRGLTGIANNTIVHRMRSASVSGAQSKDIVVTESSSVVPSLKPNGLAHNNTAVGDSLGHNVIALPSKEEPHGQPTSINDMLERGIDFNGAKYAKELRRRLRAMNSENGVSKEEAEELVSSSLKAVQYTRTGASKGDLPDDGHAVTSVVSGTPTRRVPGLDKKKKVVPGKPGTPGAANLL